MTAGSKKRVLHISKYYYPFVGGVEQTAKDCVNSLRNENVEQKVICFNHIPHSKDQIDKVEGIEVIRCGQQLIVASQALSATYGALLKKTIRVFKPDVIIFHYPNPFVAFFLLRYIPKKTKLVLYWHLDIVKQKFIRKFFKHQNYKLLERADKIVATSPNYIEGSFWLSQKKEKCVVVPSCINEERLFLTTEEHQKALTLRERYKDKIVCLAVGRHVPYKGFEYLIRASKLLDDRFVIAITGKGPLTGELHKLAEDDPKVKFLGLVSDDELKAYLQICDIFCFSSITRNEAFGLALAEGMYFGHPAVTFTIPGSGVNYVNLNGTTGLEVPNRNVKAYADALTKLADDVELRTKLGDAASKRVTENFLFSSYQKHIVQLIKSL